MGILFITTVLVYTIKTTIEMRLIKLNTTCCWNSRLRRAGSLVKPDFGGATDRQAIRNLFYCEPCMGK
jgi:hypothetical protein